MYLNYGAENTGNHVETSQKLTLLSKSMIFTINNLKPQTKPADFFPTVEYKQWSQNNTWNHMETIKICNIFFIKNKFCIKLMLNNKKGSNQDFYIIRT